MSKVYGLLVGINDYPANVGALSGCVNDAEAYRGYLTSEVSKDNLALEVLLNGDATRENIIGLFRSHLGKAGKGDVALFQYSGHGARWASAKQFDQFYPEAMDEGLVCIDSRNEGGFDLADKELAVLLAEIAAREPHLAVILDCCHSGSGTRGVPDSLARRARQTHTVHERRALETYLDGRYAQLEAKGESLFMPSSRHLLMAACNRTEQSYEDVDREGSPRGIFSLTLLELLNGPARGASYQSLFEECRRRVNRLDSRQMPQFESYGGFDSSVGFLGRKSRGSARSYDVSHDGKWRMKAGSLDGLPSDPGQQVDLKLYPRGEEDGEGLAATVLEVGPRTSLLELGFEASEDESFQAQVISMPLPEMPVLATGEAAGLAAVKAFLEENPGIGIALSDDPKGAEYEIRAQPDQLEFWDRRHERRIQASGGIDADAVQQLLERTVAHVVAWERALALQNRRTGMRVSDVEFWLTGGRADEISTRSAASDEGGKRDPFEPERVTIDVPQDSEVPLKFWVRNTSGQELHFALLYFSERYGVFKEDNRPLPSGETDVLLFEETMQLGESVAEERVIYKLIVSTDPFDDFSLEMEAIDNFGGILRQDRGAGSHAPKKHREDWFAQAIELKLVHEGDRVGSREVPLAGGAITVRAHSAVTGRASTASALISGRAAGPDAAFRNLLAGLGPERGSFEPLVFGGSRGGDAASVLELTDIEIENEQTLADEPLEIVIDAALNDDEYVLPLLFDGRQVFLGGAPSREEGKTLVKVDYLPEVASDRRSLAKALKLYFVKTQLRPGGVNQLSWVEYGADGAAVRQTEGLEERVKAAGSVLLVVHGIIGDTQGAATGLRHAAVDSKFDLVLTYDYENLSTPIEGTAADLKAKLAAVGLVEGDDKQLTILAHSMGGLVSRWFVEKSGGDEVVDHLVMCGTPNGGSPFGELVAARRLATTLTTLLLNYVPSSAPVSVPLLFLLNGSKKITPTLEQMNPGSPFLASLNVDRPQVATRYTALAGNVGDYEQESDQWLASLLTKAAQGSALEALFGTADHDVAASVESVLAGVAAGADGGRVVPCLHTNYFSAPGGLAALGHVDW